MKSKYRIYSMQTCPRSVCLSQTFVKCCESNLTMKSAGCSVLISLDMLHLCPVPGAGCSCYTLQFMRTACRLLHGLNCECFIYFYEGSNITSQSPVFLAFLGKHFSLHLFSLYIILSLSIINGYNDSASGKVPIKHMKIHSKYFL